MFTVNGVTISKSFIESFNDKTEIQGTARAIVFNYTNSFNMQTNKVSKAQLATSVMTNYGRDLVDLLIKLEDTSSNERDNVIKQYVDYKFTAKPTKLDFKDILAEFKSKYTYNTEFKSQFNMRFKHPKYDATIENMKRKREDKTPQLDEDAESIITKVVLINVPSNPDTYLNDYVNGVTIDSYIDAEHMDIKDAIIEGDKVKINKYIISKYPLAKEMTDEIKVMYPNMNDKSILDTYNKNQHNQRDILEVKINNIIMINKFFKYLDQLVLDKDDVHNFIDMMSKYKVIVESITSSKSFKEFTTKLYDLKTLRGNIDSCKKYLPTIYTNLFYEQYTDKDKTKSITLDLTDIHKACDNKFDKYFNDKYNQYYSSSYYENVGNRYITKYKENSGIDNKLLAYPYAIKIIVGLLVEEVKLFIKTMKSIM